MAINYELQDKFLETFFKTQVGRDFYLTGGTALSRFYFNHRISLDLDFFTQNQNIDFVDVNLAVLKILNKLKLKIIKQVNTETFLQYICEDEKRENLKIDIVKDIPVHFGDLIDKSGIRLDSIENIGSNKVLAIFGRSDAKDFIDLYFILKFGEFDFEHLFIQAKSKDTGLNEFYLANMMRQIELIKVYPEMMKELDKKKLVKFYKKLSEDLLTRIKPKE